MNTKRAVFFFFLSFSLSLSLFFFLYKWKTKISPGIQLTQTSFFVTVLAICFKMFSPREPAIPPHPEPPSFQWQPIWRVAYI